MSEVSLVKVYNIEPPAFSLCLPYVDMIDLASFGLKRGPESDSDWRSSAYQHLQEHVTVARLMQSTPDLDKYVTRAWVRERDSYRLRTGINSIAVRKYLRDDMVCYRVSHPDQQTEPASHASSLSL